MKKIVLITGASKGLGKVLCKLFLDKNYQVIGTYNNTYITDDYIDYQKCDLRCEEDIRKLFDYIIKKYNHLDVLINNASLCLDSDYSLKTIEEFKNVFSVNVYAPFLLMQLFVNNFKNGIVINISSLDAHDTYSSYSMDYASSKAALENLTKNFAKAIPSIRFIGIAPSWINTETVLEMNPNYLKEEMERNNQKELLDKTYVAKKILDIVNNGDYKSGMIVKIGDNNE